MESYSMVHGTMEKTFIDECEHNTNEYQVMMNILILILLRKIKCIRTN